MAATRSKERNIEANFEQYRQSWADLLPERDLGDFLQASALMRIGRILDLEFDRMCRREHGIGGADMRVLLTLRRAGPPFEQRPTDLFKAILVSSGGMSKQIDRLDEKGYVTRKPDSRHSGGFLIGLTEQGKIAVESALNALIGQSLLSRARTHTSSAQKKAGHNYIMALLQAIEHETGYGITLPHK